MTKNRRDRTLAGVLARTTGGHYGDPPIAKLRDRMQAAMDELMQGLAVLPGGSVYSVEITPCDRRAMVSVQMSQRGREHLTFLAQVFEVEVNGSGRLREVIGTHVRWW